MDKEIRKWILTIDNNDVDGIDIEYVEGTKEQVIDYVKRCCFDCMANEEGAEYVSFGEINNVMEYSCSVQFSTYHIEISAKVEQNNYVSLEKIPLEFTEYNDNGGMDSEETATWYFKQKAPKDLAEDGFTEDEINEILNSDYINDVARIYEEGHCLVIFDSLSECGANSSSRKNDCTDEEFAKSLCLNYTKYTASYEELCVKLSSGRVIQFEA